MGNTTRRRKRIREIRPEELDFSGTDAPHFDFSATDRRRFKRAVLGVPIRIRLLSETGAELGSGTAVLHDLSLDGAFLASIQIEEAAPDVPPAELTQYTRIQFTITDGPFKGAEAAATPVRVGPIEAGVGVRLESGFSFTV